MYVLTKVGGIVVLGTLDSDLLEKRNYIADWTPIRALTSGDYVHVVKFREYTRAGRVDRADNCAAVHCHPLEKLYALDRGHLVETSEIEVENK